MQVWQSSPSMNLDQVIHHLSEQISQSESEDNRVQTARIRSHKERIQDKRQERLDNLKEQMRPAAKGGCIGFLRSIVKVFDILLKPLSAITAGQLKIELGKALEMLQKSKEQKHLFGLRIQGAEITLALNNLKKFLQDDLDSVKANEKITQAQEDQLLKIIDEIHQGLVSTQQI